MGQPNVSCLLRCPYFRGVLNEGFHCISKLAYCEFNNNIRDCEHRKQARILVCITILLCTCVIIVLHEQWMCLGMQKRIIHGPRRRGGIIIIYLYPKHLGALTFTANINPIANCRNVRSLGSRPPRMCTNNWASGSEPAYIASRATGNRRATV